MADFDPFNEGDLAAFQCMKNDVRALVRTPLREAVRRHGLKPVVAELADICAILALSIGEVPKPLFLAFMGHSYDFIQKLRAKRAAKPRSRSDGRR